MKVSKTLVTSMINADLSGLNENEIELIKDFPDFTVISWGEDSNDINGKCGLSGLWDTCAEIEIITKTRG